MSGAVAQWIRHLTTNQGIPGSNPGGVDFFLPGKKINCTQNNSLIRSKYLYNSLPLWEICYNLQERSM